MEFCNTLHMDPDDEEKSVQYFKTHAKTSKKDDYSEQVVLMALGIDRYKDRIHTQIHIHWHIDSSDLKDLRQCEQVHHLYLPSCHK